EKPIERSELLALMQRTVAGVDELWLEPFVPPPNEKFNASFHSLAAALKEAYIAFGRRGFCIRSGALREGPVDFNLDFKADQRALGGRGLVQGAAREEGRAGIEITYVTSACKSGLLEGVQRTRPVASIPASTDTVRASRREVA